ncbi:MAG: hypothetical protein ACKO5E_01240 [bacterium]
MKHDTVGCDCYVCADQELWNQVKQRAAALPVAERSEWSRLIASLQERDEMTVQALRLAESGLRMMARRMTELEQQKVERQQLFTAGQPAPADFHWRVDPQPGSGGCMWLA